MDNTLYRLVIFSLSHNKFSEDLIKTYFFRSDMSYENLKKFWEENIKANIKKISAIIGDIIITIITILLLGVKGGIDGITVLLMIIFGIKPFIVMYLNIVFKGEANAQYIDNLQLQQQLGYEREIAEYRVRLAAKNSSVPDAIVATKDWNNSNEIIKKIEEGK